MLQLTMKLDIATNKNSDAAATNGTRAETRLARADASSPDTGESRGRRSERATSELVTELTQQ